MYRHHVAEVPVRIRIHFLIDHSFLSPARFNLPTHPPTHPLTHSLSLRGHPTRSPLSDRIANARQLVTRSLVGCAFPRLMFFVLPRPRRLSPCPRCLGRDTYRTHSVPSHRKSLPLPRRYKTTPLCRTDNWTGSFWSHAPGLPPSVVVTAATLPLGRPVLLPSQRCQPCGKTKRGRVGVVHSSSSPFLRMLHAAFHKLTPIPSLYMYK
ncbi:hypothetical protein BJY52DRAFT_963879 [Lactarius psammicola]|nr:hypothetical protein BJY52DRAFT_963879 [Lactarius psammicola]